MNDLGKFDLKRAAIFSDIHWGKRGDIHNKDCLDFIDFLIGHASNPANGIDHIVFMGDWFDKRDAINISTLNYSNEALVRLNKLGIPIFVEVGNHDLYLRNNRTIHSLIYFGEFENCYLIDTPTTAEISGVKVLFMPYIFQEEYVPMAVEVNAADVVYAHLELKGFVLTGSTVVLEHGHDQALFDKPKRIFTGHFHKRQNKGNVYYTGNPFPFDFSDANDTDRGFAIYDYATDGLSFVNHLDAPSYVKCSLSKLISDHKKLLKPKTVVHCAIDTDISMEEHTELKELFSEKYKLRELNLTETGEDLTQMGAVDLDDSDVQTTLGMIRELLDKLVVDKLNKNTLIEIFEGL